MSSSASNNCIADASFSITNESDNRTATWLANVLCCFRQRRPICLANTLWFFSPTSVLASFGLPYLHMSLIMCMVLWNVGSFHPLPVCRGKQSRTMVSIWASDFLASMAYWGCWESFQNLSIRLQASKHDKASRASSTFLRFVLCPFATSASFRRFQPSSNCDKHINKNTRPHSSLAVMLDKLVTPLLKSVWGKFLRADWRWLLWKVCASASNLYFWDAVMHSKINDMARAMIPLRTECIGSVGTEPNILYTGSPISMLANALWQWCWDAAAQSSLFPEVAILCIASQVTAWQEKFGSSNSANGTSHEHVTRWTPSV